MADKSLTEQQKYSRIVSYVKKMRKRQGIATTPGFKPEPSCIMQGEFYNLLWFQLMRTPEGTWGWLELKDPNVLDGVYREVLSQDE